MQHLDCEAMSQFKAWKLELNEDAVQWISLNLLEMQFEK